MKTKRPYEHLRLTSLSEIHVGAEVFWHDPDDDACSRYAIVTSMPLPEEGEDGIITLDGGTEVFIHELS